MRVRAAGRRLVVTGFVASLAACGRSSGTTGDSVPTGTGGTGGFGGAALGTGGFGGEVGGAGGAVGEAGGAASGAGGAAPACTACVTSAACGQNAQCAQLVGDSYCVAACGPAGSCAAAATCSTEVTIEGQQVQVCLPATGRCAARSSSTGGASGMGGAGEGGGAPQSCGPLDGPSIVAGCTSCRNAPAGTTCQANGCYSGWWCNRQTAACQSPPSPATCAAGGSAGSGSVPTSCGEADGPAGCCAPDGSVYYCAADGSTLEHTTCASGVCGWIPDKHYYGCTTSSGSDPSGVSPRACGAGGAGGAGAGGASGAGGSAGASGVTGAVGPGGGTLSLLRFAIVGDTRPAFPAKASQPTEGYPSAVASQIWRDVQAQNVPFAVSTGDYVFADPSTKAAGPQLDAYIAARAAFKNVVFPAMGNHECNGATASNCGPGNADGVTDNYTQFLAKMLAPIQQTKPYYDLTINGTSGWSAKFLFVAGNAWDAGQAAWLKQALAHPTTYTFVVRHEPRDVTQAPGVTPSVELTTGVPITLSLVGHTHTYRHQADTREVIVGNGGAPLTSGANYGYVIGQQRADGAIEFRSYDYGTNAVVDTFAVKPDGSAAP